MGQIYSMRRRSSAIYPEYTYSGNVRLVDEGDGNWHLEITETGSINFSNLGNGRGGVDILCVGGGGGAAYQAASGVSGGEPGVNGAGGGGYISLTENAQLTTDVAYTTTIGGAGAKGTAANSTNGKGSNGGATSIKSGATTLYSANGGNGGAWLTTGGGSGGKGGSGGAGVLAGQSGFYANALGGRNGGNGGGDHGGTGSGTTTTIFGVEYSRGGSCGSDASYVVPPRANKGDGGNTGGAAGNNVAGSAGVIIIRNHRAA